jgi:hypothetical protein
MKTDQKREQWRNRGEERKANPRFSKKERRTLSKTYKRSTETKSQTKARRMNGSKEYQRQRNVNLKRYPNAPVQLEYQRPSFQLKSYKRPKKKRKGK